MKKITSKKFTSQTIAPKDSKKIKGGKKNSNKFVIIEDMRDL